MNIFSKSKKTVPGIVIAGCNKTSIALAEGLGAQRFMVPLIDESAEAFEPFASTYAGNVIIGDAANDRIITDSNMKNAKEIFVFTGADNKNIFIAQILRRKLGDEPKIVARLNDPARASEYAAFEMETVSMENLFAEEISRNLHSILDGEQL